MAKALPEPAESRKHAIGAYTLHGTHDSRVLTATARAASPDSDDKLDPAGCASRTRTCLRPRSTDALRTRSRAHFLKLGLAASKARASGRRRRRTARGSAVTTADWRRHVTADWLRRARTGEGIAPDWSGVMSVTNGLVASGLPDTSIRTILLDEDNAGARFINVSSRGYQRPRSVRERQVANAIRTAHARQRRSNRLRDRKEVVVECARLRLAVQDAPEQWTGKGGATDQAVLLGLIGIAERVGRLKVGASVRELGDAANVTACTAYRALHRLAARRWLRIMEVGSGTRASVICLERAQLQPSGSSLTGEDEGCSNARLTADAWRWGRGLGKRAAHVYGLLTYEPVTTRDLAALLAIQPGTARRHLHRLEDYDLARRTAAGWVRGPGRPGRDRAGAGRARRR